ncbi:MAG: class I SAM-dependent methyltransferase [Microbacteriaceae bacterium]|nr:class I SAM-dependent methyltransferase [Microbacteriaceae bacterium]
MNDHHETEQDAVPQSAAEIWESRYADSDRVWTGKVNGVLADIAGALAPGNALDLGCGEGGDAVWLAQQGWHATGVDLSPTAVERGRRAAQSAGIPASALNLIAADLATWEPSQTYDLVTCSYLHSWPISFPRDEILRRATDYVAPGGHLIVTSHAEAPPWANAAHHTDHEFPTPESELNALELEPHKWEIITSELRTRETVGPDGKTAVLRDVVIHARRIE